MRWAKAEYILKGVFLGLLLFVSLQKGLDWAATGRVALWLAGGLLVALVLATARQWRDISGLGRNPLGFLLFLLLENPLLIYCGIILGLAGAAIELRLSFIDKYGADNLPHQANILGYCVFGGAIFGYGLGELRQIRHPLYRLGITAILCAAVGVMLYYWLEDLNFLGDNETERQLLGVHLLLGIPFFYLLVFCGMAEESEGEIAALCATFGLGMYLVKFPANMPALGTLLPVGLYCVYTIRVMRPLRVFKHALRGYGHSQVGRIKDALASFDRALQLDPRNALARHGMVRLHRGLKIDRLDASTKALLNPTLVVNEAANLLLAGTPSAGQLREANDLLDFVANQWPQLKPTTDYYKAVADTHAHRLDAAVERLSTLLDPEAWPAGDRYRDSILFDAWQLALRTHSGLKRRVGEAQLPLPGRRVEALRAVERQLRTNADPAVASLRSELLDGLTEPEYAGAAAGGPIADFPYAFVEEVGLPLLESAEAWRRGALLIRIAAHGQPDRGPGLFDKLAQVADRFGDTAEAQRNRRRVREFGQAVGPANLPADQKAIYFATVKKLGEEAQVAKDWKEAIANYQALSTSESAGKETLRTLAQMYENDGQVFAALRTTEDALTRGSDADLQARKDKYYFSVDPEELKQRADEVRGHFDVKYCFRKAKQLLDSNSTELDVLDWATHLSKVALVMEPKNLVANVQMGRCNLRRGERDEGTRHLEDVLEMQASGADEREAREWTLRQLGALYLDEYHRPDFAITCLQEFLSSEKSGARTLYDLGRAYEQKGDTASAMKYYRQAAAYEDNPIRWDAEEAIRRLKEGATASGSETA
jgi:tetratricopeptide (TPR) repeat protein